MNKRQSQILDLLNENKKVEVTKLSELLQVSQVTIRKDLDALESSGMLIRAHGYAAVSYTHLMAVCYLAAKKILSYRKRGHSGNFLQR